MKFCIHVIVLSASIQLAVSQISTLQPIGGSTTGTTNPDISEDLLIFTFPINPNTGLREDPETNIQYDPDSRKPLVRKAQVRQLFPGITNDQIHAFFSYLYPCPTPFLDLISSFPRNLNTSLREDPETKIQYDPNTGLPIVTVAQVKSIFPEINYEQLHTLFSYLFPTTAAPPCSLTFNCQSLCGNHFQDYFPCLFPSRNAATSGSQNMVFKVEPVFQNMFAA